MKKHYSLLFTLFISFFSLKAQTIPVLLSLDNPSGIAFHEGIIYVSNYDANSISKADITNQNLPIYPDYFITYLYQPWGIAINNDYLYTLDNGKLLRFDLSLQTPVIEIVVSVQGHDLLFDDDILYIGGSGSIYKLDTSLDSVNLELVTNAPTSSYIGMAIKNDSLYYSDFNSSIFKLDPNVPNPNPILVQSGFDSPRGLVFHGNELYVAEYSNGDYDVGKISKIDVSTSFPAIELVTDENLTGPWNLAIYENELYISEFPINTVSKIAIGEPLSIEDNTLSSIQIYPNPINGKSLHLSGLKDSQRFSIHDSMGKNIMQGVLHINEKINIENLKTGIYFLKIENSKVLKFVKN